MWMPWPMTSKEEISAVLSVIGPTYHATGSMDLTHSPLKSMKKDLKKTPNKRTLDQGLFIFLLILQACNLRDRSYSLLSTGALSLEEQMGSPCQGALPGAPCEGCSKPWRLVEAAWVAHHPVHPKNLVKEGKRICSHKSPSTLCSSSNGKTVLCRLLKHQSCTILCPATPQPPCLVPTAEIHLLESKAGSLCYLHAVLRASIPDNLAIFLKNYSL